MVSPIQIDSQGRWQIVVPQYGLTSDSLCIQNNEATTPDVGSLYTLMQKVSSFAENKKLPYLWYREPDKNRWTMVPYYGNSHSLWDRIKAYARQFLVMGRVIWGEVRLSEKSRQTLLNTYQTIKQFQIPNTQAITPQEDAFCKSTVIDSQKISEKIHMQLLYNYAPIGKEGLHFLIVPKIHKETMSQLSKEEFIEMQEFVNDLKNHYKDYTCFEYHKAGRLAGQTVPHFHAHLVFIRQEDTLMGKLSVFWRMIKTPTPLPKTLLAQRVQELKTSLVYQSNWKDLLK